MAEAWTHARGSVPERFQVGGEGSGALVAQVVLSAADGGLDGEAGAEEQEHADALSWAAEAKKMGQAEPSTKGGPMVESSNLTRLG